jgi:hypothetical protein
MIELETTLFLVKFLIYAMLAMAIVERIAKEFKL